MNACAMCMYDAYVLCFVKIHNIFVVVVAVLLYVSKKARFSCVMTTSFRIVSAPRHCINSSVIFQTADVMALS